MIYLNIHYEMRRHGLNGQQLAAALGLPLRDVILKLYGKTEFSLHEIEQLADLFGCSLDYLVGHPVVTRTLSPEKGMDSIMRGLMPENLMWFNSVT